MIVTIRNEATSDIDAIEAVTIAAFRDAPHTNHTEQFIVRALRSAGQLSISLVADDNHGIVGHAAVSPVTISGGCRGWYGLGPISVLPRHQGQGVGTQLVRRTLAELRESGAAGCVVLGEPAFYSRFGFKPEPRLTLAGVPPEYFHAISFLGPVPAGVVAYSPAFEAREYPS